MTDEMGLYILGNFEWYHIEVVFPPGPLPYNYKGLCLDFDLAVAEEYAQDYKVPELPQVVFLAMLLNDAVKLGVLRGWMIVSWPSKRCGGMLSRHGCGLTGERAWRPVDIRHLVTRKKRRARGPTTKPPFLVVTARSEGRLATTFEACILESLFTTLTMAFPLFQDAGEMADYVRETFQWHWRSASCPSSFTSGGLLRAMPTLYSVQVCDSELPEMVQVTFYTMLLNDAVELGIVSVFMATDLKETLEGLR
ncbi:LOW QUALITY PROTEIN: hypothetical protein Cgig2_006569 [Carnegiea gigantea]|uniref:Uncharacterized protein n=1 Tax=Carnegiea gigantea TaxID=171969 RepID=A0A9Q1GU14_9CARY|nr:LOW QUALITY PROTEIN: hypothetical protein Cgig2_006569 [Carnegiea gigantea]